MFPSFTHLAKAFAAERAADFQRDAAIYRRSHDVRRSPATTGRDRLRRLRGHRPRPAAAAR